MSQINIPASIDIKNIDLSGLSKIQGDLAAKILGSNGVQLMSKFRRELQSVVDTGSQLSSLGNGFQSIEQSSKSLAAVFQLLGGGKNTLTDLRNSVKAFTESLAQAKQIGEQLARGNIAPTNAVAQIRDIIKTLKESGQVGEEVAQQIKEAFAQSVTSEIGKDFKRQTKEIESAFDQASTNIIKDYNNLTKVLTKRINLAESLGDIKGLEALREELALIKSLQEDAAKSIKTAQSGDIGARTTTANKLLEEQKGIVAEITQQENKLNDETAKSNDLLRRNQQLRSQVLALQNEQLGLLGTDPSQFERKQLLREQRGLQQATPAIASEQQNAELQQQFEILKAQTLRQEEENKIVKEAESFLRVLNRSTGEIEKQQRKARELLAIVEKLRQSDNFAFSTRDVAQLGFLANESAQGLGLQTVKGERDAVDELQTIQKSLTGQIKEQTAEREEEARIESLIESRKKQILRLQETLNDLLQAQTAIQSKHGLQLTDQQKQVKQIIAANAGDTARQQILGIGGEDLDPDKLRRLTKETRELSKELKSFDANTFTLENFGKAAALAFKRYSAFLIGSFGIFEIINAFRIGTTEALKLEKALTKIEQVTTLTTFQMQALSSSIKDLSSRRGFSAEELASGVFEFAQAGFQDLDELNTLAQQLAKIPLTATFGSIQQVTEGLLAIFGQFNKEASDTAEVLDLVNKFAADFAIESQDIFEIVKRGGSAFATAGGSFEELISLSSILRESTRESAETLGTFFKSGTAQLLSSGSQDRLRQLGITSQGLVNQLTDLSDVLLGVNSKFNTVERINIAEELVGQRQFGRLLALLRELQDPAIRDRVQNALENAVGSLDASTTKRLDDLGTSVGRLREELNKFISTLLNNDGLRLFVKGIADLAQELGSLLGIVAPAIPLLGQLGVALSIPVVARAGQGVTNFVTGTRRESSSQLIARNAAPELIALQTAKEAKALRASRRIAGAGVIGATALIGSNLLNDNFFQDRDFGQINNAANVGLGTGLLVGAFNPVVGVIVGLTTAAITLITAIDANTKAQRAEDLRSRNIQTQIRTVFRNPEFVQAASPFRREEIVSRNGLPSRFREIENFAARDASLALITNALATGGGDLQEGDFKTSINTLLQIFNNITKESLKTARDLDLDVTSIRESIKQQIADIFSEYGVDASTQARLTESVLTNLQPLFTAFAEKLIDPIELIQSQLNSLRQTLLLVNTDFNNFSKGLGDFSTILNNIIANPNQTVLANPLPSSLSNTQFVDDLASQLSSFLGTTGIRSSIRNFLAPREDNNTEVQIFRNARDLFTGLLGGQNLVSATPELQVLLDQLTGQFTNTFNALIAAGLTAEDIFSGISESTNLREFAANLTEIDELQQSVNNAIKAQIEVFNQRITVEKQLADSSLNVSQNIFTLSQNLVELQQTLEDRVFTATASRNQGAGLSNALTIAQQLFSRASGAGGGIGTLIANALQAADRRNRAAQDAAQANINFSGDTNALFKAIEESNNAQIEFAKQQQLVNQQLSLLDTAISNASQAVDTFNSALDTIQSQIANAGNAIRSFTIDDLAESFSAFDRFIAASGLTAGDIGQRSGISRAGRGLESISDDDFAALERLLSGVGAFDLGGGISGADILSEINRAIALPALARLRSSVTGETTDVAQESILSQIEQIEQQRNAALEEEKRLRQEQIQLIDLQRQLALKEAQFIDDQRAILLNVASQLNNFGADSIRIIKDKVNQFFTSNPQLVTLDPQQIKEITTPTVSLPTIDASAPIRRPLPSSNSPRILDPGNVIDIPLPPTNRERFFSPPGGPRPIGGDPSFNIPTLPNNTRPLPSLPNLLSNPNLIISGGTIRNPESEVQLNTINTTLVSIKDVLSNGLSRDVVTRLEVAPMQVTVALTTPDILRNVGPELKKSIIKEIASKLAEVFGDDPEKQSRINELGA